MDSSDFPRVHMHRVYSRRDDATFWDLRLHSKPFVDYLRYRVAWLWRWPFGRAHRKEIELYCKDRRMLPKVHLRHEVERYLHLWTRRRGKYRSFRYRWRAKLPPAPKGHAGYWRGVLQGVAEGGGRLRGEKRPYLSLKVAELWQVVLLERLLSKFRIRKIVVVQTRAFLPRPEVRLMARSSLAAFARWIGFADPVRQKELEEKI